MGKNIKHLLLLFLFVLALPYNVKAANCTKEESSLFNRLVNNIEINYEHISNNEFSIKITNIPNEIVVYDIYGNTYSNNGNNISNPGTFKAKESYKFFFVPSDNWDCELELEYSKTIYIRQYNLYSERGECNGIDYSEFKYCSPNYQGSITEEKFISELNKYKNTITEEVVGNGDINNNNSFFDTKYLIIGIVGIILIITFIIVKAIKNKRRKI